VMNIRFVPNTHYFFTVSKDHLIKYWDADNFSLISTLNGHKGEVWSLAIGELGSFLVTGSHDRSLRLWKLTDEMLFLEEERENEMDQLFESTLEDHTKALSVNV